MKSPSKLNVAAGSMQADDRILITGATGWLGRSAIAVVQNTGLPLLLFSSKAGTVTVDGSKSAVEAMDFGKASAFKPTVVIDTAFLTRDKLSQVGFKAYVETNRRLIQFAKEVSRITSVRKFIGLSSGAAVPHLQSRIDDFAVDPYGALKAEYENTLLDGQDKQSNQVLIARAYSLSGRFARNRSSYALFDIIDQAVASDTVVLTSPAYVFRRYMDAEEFLAMSLASAPSIQPLESGGELLELGDLAKLAVSVLAPKAQVIRPRVSKQSDHYHSDGEAIRVLSEELDFQPASITEQILFSVVSE